VEGEHTDLAAEPASEPGRDEDWFEPGKREGYEAALGRMILAYNEIDFRVCDVIHRAAARQGLEAAAMIGAPFETRLDVLAFLGAIHDLRHIKELDLGELSELHTHRNSVTHGHFDVDHDGSLQVRRWRKKGPVAIPNYDTDRLHEIAERMRAHVEVLHRVELLLWFDDLDDADDPEGR